MKIINKGSLKLFCLVAILAISLPAHAKKGKHKSGLRIHAWEKEDAILHQRIDAMQLTPGLAGPQGADGTPGPLGPAGSMGPDGPMGPAGSMGPDGPMGPAGSMGPDGPMGPAGPKGPAGPIGLSGLAGANGAEGARGSVGSAGTKGVDGDPGIDGLDGLPGKDASDRTAELCALYNELSRQSLLGALAVPDFCTGSDDPTSTYTIGSTGPGGGIVFYISEGGLHGLEAAPADQSASAEWGCYNTGIVEGARGTAIGTGELNTANIVAAGCVTSLGGDDTAANIADAYVSTNGSNDWFLPSSEELNLLFINKNRVGGFTATENAYWSSTNFATRANGQAFGGGTRGAFLKSRTFGVRAIRAF